MHIYLLASKSLSAPLSVYIQHGDLTAAPMAWMCIHYLCIEILVSQYDFAKASVAYIYICTPFGEYIPFVALLKPLLASKTAGF